MDTELETVEQYGGSVIREVPLSVNGLFQRVGRVGRSRPGAAFITREETESGEHAAYSLWDEGQLATGLKLERVSYAIQQGHVRELAFFLYESSVPQDLESTKNFLASFLLPSAPHKNPATLRSLREERLRIQEVGLTDDGVSLNVIGQEFRDIAVVQDLHLGKMLAYCLVQKKPSIVLYVALVAAASESKTLRDILGRRTYLEDPTALRLRVPFPQEEFSEPLTSVYALLGTVSKGNLPDVESITASEETAHHIFELLESGYRPEEPTAPGATGADAEPAVLFLSKPVIPLDPRSEVISTFNIISYFFNRYRRELRNPLYSEFEISRVRQALRSECVDLGLNPFAVDSVLGRVAEVARHARVRLQQADADSRSSRANDIVRTALSRQLEIDCATSMVDKEALPELEAHLSGGAPLPPALLRHVNERRRALQRIVKRLHHPESVEMLPELTETDRVEFLLTFNRLAVYDELEVRNDTDYRGIERYVGETEVSGQKVMVEIERHRTCLRTNREVFRVRGKVIPRSFLDDDGTERVRYTLGFTTLCPAR